MLVCWHAYKYICTYAVIERLGLEETFRGHLAQPPCREQGHLQVDQVAQSPVQPDLECFQGWGISQVVGNPCQGFTTLRVIMVFSNLNNSMMREAQ